MSSKVTFDVKGELGPAMALIYRAHECEGNELSEIISILKTNCKSVSNLRIKGRKEFCRFIESKNEISVRASVIEILGNRLFQDMQKTDPLPVYHEKVIRYIVPNMLNTLPQFIPIIKEHPLNNEETQCLQNWVARVLETYMTEEQINNECKFQKLVESKPQIRTVRNDMGKFIYAAAEKGKLTEKSFNYAILVLKNSVNDVHFICEAIDEVPSLQQLESCSVDDPQMLEGIISGYLNLFAMAEDKRVWMGNYIIDMLTKIFRSKFFPAN